MKFYGSIATGVCKIWLRFEPNADQNPDPCIQNCKADSAKSNGRVSKKFYEWIACELRKTAFNFGSDTDHIRDAVTVSGFYPDYWLRRILTKFGAEMASKVKVKHNKNTY